jgi:hypothetical protein
MAAIVPWETYHFVEAESTFRSADLKNRDSRPTISLKINDERGKNGKRAYSDQ